MKIKRQVPPSRGITLGEIGYGVPLYKKQLTGDSKGVYEARRQ